ncbi:U3 small nucleolar RNA-associated protein 22, partial [Tremellales sp. Uapishka_1]
MGGVDLVVAMPDALFSAKDRMSYRYFHKRLHYLAVIKAALEKLDALEGVDIRWENAMGDARRPIIVLRAGKEQGLKYRLDVRIHASISKDVFPLSTLYPSKSLIRVNPEPSDPIKTPLYSTSILHDTLHKPYLMHLHHLSQSLTPERSLDSFLSLWRIWTSRRSIHRQRGGSGWFGSMALSWIVQGGEIGGKKYRGLGKTLGPWGGLRAVWEFLAHTDFAKTPVFVATTGDDGVPKAEFGKCFEDIFVDPTGMINLLAGWEKGELGYLQRHARETLAMLEDAAVDRFADVFLKSYTLGVKVFDEYIQVDTTSSSLAKFDVLQRSERPALQDLLVHSMGDILSRGLGDRATLVRVDAISADSVAVGIIYNPECATRVIDIGPSADHPVEGTAFRELWGDKAELRRFKDGSISESVVWDLTRPEEATLIPGKIVQWLLPKHFAVAESEVEIVSSNPDWLKVIQIPPSARDAVSVAGSERQGFRPMMEAYDSFYKVLKSIDSELPLSILHVTPTSELLRYSSVFVPHPVEFNRYGSAPECAKYIPYAEIVMQFESSPRWPDDLAAIQKVKLALMEKVGRVVMDQMSKAKACVVFDSDAESEIEDSASLEVLLPQGIALRVRIFHEREKTLLERVVQGDAPSAGTALPQPPRKLAVPALAKHLHRFIDLPKHHSSIAPLHHRFPSYSSATRLLKRWIGAHMLALHVRAEVVELIMARIYLDPGCLHTPSSATSGFVRAIELLAEWEWRSEPMFVPNFSATEGRARFPAEKRERGQEKFENLRKKDKEIVNGAWVVITEEDEDGLKWTRKGPSRVVAGRIAMLAKATLSALQSGFNVKSLFITPLTQYDFVIHLNPSVLPRYSQGVSPDEDQWESKLKFRNLSHTSEVDARVGFDPAEAFVRDLQRVYGDALLIFFDLLGGTAVGGLWNPAKEQPRSLKPFLGYNSRPTETGSELVVINKIAILSEIARLGEGMINKITKKA